MVLSPSLLGLLLLGCVHSYNGVLLDEGEELMLYRSDGPPLRLQTSEGSEELGFLQECTVEVEGRQVLRSLRVSDWTVLAAADGSAPFVGVLRMDGRRLLIDDRVSGATYVLQSDEDLERFAGHSMLVIGFVTGPQVVQVMGWRLLEEP